MRTDYYDEDGYAQEYDDYELDYIYYSIYPEEDSELLREIERDLNE